MLRPRRNADAARRRQRPRVAREVLLRERGPLVRRDRLGADDARARRRSPRAERLRAAGSGEPGADDQHAAGCGHAASSTASTVIAAIGQDVGGVEDGRVVGLADEHGGDPVGADCEGLRSELGARAEATAERAVDDDPVRAHRWTSRLRGLMRVGVTRSAGVRAGGERAAPGGRGGDGADARRRRARSPRAGSSPFRRRRPWTVAAAKIA